MSDTVQERCRIVLTDNELEICRDTAYKRFLCNRGAGVTDRQRGKQAKLAIDMDGMVGEFAAARMLNLCPDLSVSERSGGHDLVSRYGKTIDVKATRRADGRLLGEVKKAGAYCDVYMLMIVDDVSATFAGWAWGHELFDPANLTDLGHGQTYALPQSALYLHFK